MLFSTCLSKQPAMDIVTGELLQLSRQNFQFLLLIYYYISSVQKNRISIIMVIGIVIRLSILTVNAVIAEKRLYIADKRHI
jgi:membrane protein insertase Oxa1/YidC/SpoIIIJ